MKSTYIASEIALNQAIAEEALKKMQQAFWQDDPGIHTTEDLGNCNLKIIAEPVFLGVIAMLQFRVMHKHNTALLSDMETV